MKVTREDLLHTIQGEWSGDIESSGDLGPICLDTRRIRAGEIFIGIAGERFDGSQFAEEALKKGAAGVVVTRPPPAGYPLPGQFWVKVEDGLGALWQTVSCLRQRFAGWVIAVTGTAGKSSTKEWIACALSEKKKVHRSLLSENNEIGVPKTILEAPEDTEVLVLEFGMRHPGDIQKLTELARPHIGVITSITPVHLETMKDIGRIVRGKGELLVGLEPPAISVINADSEHTDTLRKISHAVLTFGRQGEFSFETVKMDERGRCVFRLVTPSWEGEFESPLAGEIQGYGITAALAVAEAVGVSPQDALKGMQKVTPLPHRLQVHLLKEGGVLIDDSYNSSPAAMREAIYFTAKIAGPRRKIAILGEMLELGEKSETLHQQVGEWIAETHFDLFVGVGNGIAPALRSVNSVHTKTLHFATAKEVATHLAEIADESAVVLIKGSRAVHMETVVEEYLRWTGQR